MSDPPTALELCAGAGGQLLGLEMAGFHTVAAVEIDPDACNTLRANRPDLAVVEGDLRQFSAGPYEGADLVAGGVPCPPFSIAGKQLGKDDERDLFPTALRIVAECRPKAVMLENVRGFASAKFADYRRGLFRQLDCLGYASGWRVLQASAFGVSQLRPRFILVAVRKDLAAHFTWPEPHEDVPPPVGDLLYDLMGANRWPGARAWKRRACGIAPTLVGGSKKHGGPDLGPSRAKAQWKLLGVNGAGVGDEAPTKDFPPDGLPKLTVPMVARLQSFPDDWHITGRKTAAYRQVGNAFPPKVSAAVATQILRALSGSQADLGRPPGGELFPISLLAETRS